MEYFGIGNKTAGNMDVDVGSYSKCNGCEYNRNKGQICSNSINKKWCHVEVKTCLLIKELKSDDEFKGPKPGAYKIVKKDKHRWFINKKAGHKLLCDQGNLNLLTIIDKKKRNVKK